MSRPVGTLRHANAFRHVPRAPPLRLDDRPGTCQPADDVVHGPGWHARDPADLRRRAMARRDRREHHAFRVVLNDHGVYRAIVVILVPRATSRATARAIV